MIGAWASRGLARGRPSENLPLHARSGPLGKSGLMDPPPGWTNPIVAVPGQFQRGIDPTRLRPSRRDLEETRLDAQRALLLANRPRATPILVSTDGVIFDGHHAARVAAEEGRPVDIMVTSMPVIATAATILELPVR